MDKNPGMKVLPFEPGFHYELEFGFTMAISLKFPTNITIHHLDFYLITGIKSGSINNANLKLIFQRVISYFLYFIKFTYSLKGHPFHTSIPLTLFSNDF